MNARGRSHRPGLVGICRLFLPIALRRWGALLAVAASVAAEIALTLLQPWPIKILVDNVLGGKPLGDPLAGVFAALPGAETRGNLLYWTVSATVAIFVLSWAAGLARSYANVAFGKRIVYDLGGALFDHLQRLSLRFHAQHGIGSLIRRITTDSESIATIVAGVLVPAVAALVALGSIFVVMWQLDPVLTLLSLGAVPSDAPRASALLAADRGAKLRQQRGRRSHV
jgi:ABC-type multidrug transport system fused ATPase/permease subunit